MAEKWWRLFTAFIIGAPWGTYIRLIGPYANQFRRRKRVQASADSRRSDYSGSRKTETTIRHILERKSRGSMIKRRVGDVIFDVKEN